MTPIEEMLEKLSELAKELGHNYVELLNKTGEKGKYRMQRFTLTEVRCCRECGCTEEDCEQCIVASGVPCHWVEYNLCSRCEAEQEAAVS